MDLVQSAIRNRAVVETEGVWRPGLVLASWASSLWRIDKIRHGFPNLFVRFKGLVICDSHSSYPCAVAVTQRVSLRFQQFRDI